MDRDFTDNFKVKTNQKFHIKDYSTTYEGHMTKEQGEQLLVEEKEKIYELQEKLYAEDRQSLLIIIQAMDAAGKDGLIEHVFSGVNPQGCEVTSFKAPSLQEYDHDFIWRHYLALPQKGKIGIFNRSHYESVLVCKVHPEYNLNEKVWKSIDDFDEDFWKNRYESIRDFEKHISRNGTKIIKLFLHVSKEEQKERLLSRIDEHDKHWKFEFGDLKERALWDHYQQAYEEAINETNTECAPWYVLPADKKWLTRVAACQIIINALEDMNVKFPEITAEEKSKLEEAKKILLS